MCAPGRIQASKQSLDCVVLCLVLCCWWVSVVVRFTVDVGVVPIRATRSRAAPPMQRGRPQSGRERPLP